MDKKPDEAMHGGSSYTLPTKSFEITKNDERGIPKLTSYPRKAKSPFMEQVFAQADYDHAKQRLEEVNHAR